MANPYGDKKVESHVKEISERTAEARKFFNLAEQEKVVQDYGCTRKVATGRLYVTQNFVGFRSALPKLVESFPMRRIKRLEKVKLASILMVLDDGNEHEYGGFTQRDEAFAILQHLWQNPPSYSLVDTRADVAPKSPRITDNDGTMLDLTGAQQTQSQSQRHDNAVDTESSRRALQKMYQARDMGMATLDELDRQGEVLNGMETRIESMHSAMDQNDKNIRAINSVGGAFANRFVKDKQRTELVFATREHKIEALKKRDTEVEMLYKFPSDKLVPALLVFKEKVFVCADATSKTKLVDKGAQFEYSDVKLVLIRARHQHLDVWFKTGGKEKRIRLMSAHVQFITNEMALRVGPELDVQWEPGAKKFDYGSVELAQAPPPKGRANGADADGWGVGQKSKTSGLISKSAPQKVKDDLALQDAHLEEMSAGMDELYGIGIAIGNAVDDSTVQVKRVTGKVETATARIEQQDAKVQQLIKKK